MDTADTHRDFAGRHGIVCPLLADPSGELCGRLGVRKPEGGVKRTTFVIDESGSVARIFENVKVAGHAQEVLDALREMRAKNAAGE